MLEDQDVDTQFLPTQILHANCPHKVNNSKTVCIDWFNLSGRLIIHLSMLYSITLDSNRNKKVLN